MTRGRRPACDSQDKILRSLAEGLWEPRQAAQDDTTNGFLQPEPCSSRDGGGQDDGLASVSLHLAEPS